MSFSSDLKKELCEVCGKARHCRIAAFAAAVGFAGEFVENNQSITLRVSSENREFIFGFKKLASSLFGAEAAVNEKKSSRNLKLYYMELTPSQSKEAADAVKLAKADGVLMPSVAMLTEKSCCKASFLREAFLASGSVSSPDKSYHLEILCKNKYLAENTERLMDSFSVPAKIAKRKSRFVVYVKESDKIADLIGVMGARTSLFEIKNIRILREMRGNINRRVNCEAANINKAALASARQIEDILYIDEHIGLSTLSNGLDEIARIRLQYPEATTDELGAYLKPPLGKSGVNHRLRKLSSIAKVLRG